MSSFERSSLDVVGSLWEELAQLLQDILGDTHENDIRHWLKVTVLLVLWGMSQGLEQDVGLEVVQDLVVAEVRVLWKVEDGFLLFDFVILVVVDLNESLSDEVHLLDVGFVGDDGLARCVDTAVHADDELVGESSLALLEEMVEGSFKLLEDSGVLNKISLHLWGDLLIELEFLDDEVEIVEESLLDVLSDVVVERRLNMEGLV